MKRKMILFFLILGILSTIQAADLIVNEFNCVSTNNYLDSKIYSDEGKTSGLESDEYFASVDPLNLDGRIQGNGGDWMELVVTTDHLDIRGWKILIVATDTEKAPDSNGTDIWCGDPNLEQSTITFSPTSDVLSDMRAGTILTISSSDSIGIDTDDYGFVDKNFTTVPESYFDIYLDLSTDLSFDPTPVDPNDRDWWIHISSTEEAAKGPDALLTTQCNVTNIASGGFSISDGSMEITVTDNNGNIVFGPIGEDVPGWGGSGVNDREVGSLETFPTNQASQDDFSDNVFSTFGMPNRWGKTGQNLQNFGQIRSWLYPPQNCKEARDMGYILEMDFNKDCIVNLSDLIFLFADRWMDCIVPGGETCSEPWKL